MCKPRSSSLVECLLPAVTTVPQLQPSVEEDDDSRQLASNETRTCLLSSATSAPAAPLVTQFGFTFDGLTSYSEYGNVTLYASPQLCVNDTFVEHEVFFPEQIDIKVNNTKLYNKFVKLKLLISLFVMPPQPPLSSSEQLYVGHCWWRNG